MEATAKTESDSTLALLDEASIASSEEYSQLQMRLFRATLLLSLVFIAVGAILYGPKAALSLLAGSLSGLLYLRLLARSIGKLGKSTKGVGKIQLLVPVLLFLAVSKLPELELLPALLGFLLYKPSLVIQTWLDSRA